MEKPIIFSTDMRKAILTCAKCGKISVEFPCSYCGSKDFRKTVTRRVMKPQPPEDIKSLITRWENQPRGWFAFQDNKEIWPYRNWGNAEPKIRYPYKKGDILWVREKMDLWPGTIAIYCDGEQISPSGEKQEWLNNYKNAVVPPIHMPKWAARIWLEVVNVRPEILQEITEEDILAEGINYIFERAHVYKSSFALLWDRINAKRGYPWESNPFVWRIEFKRIVKRNV